MTAICFVRKWWLPIFFIRSFQILNNTVCVKNFKIAHFFGFKTSRLCSVEEGGGKQGSQSHRKHIHRLAYAYHVRQLF